MADGLSSTPSSPGAQPDRRQETGIALCRAPASAATASGLMPNMSAQLKQFSTKR